MQHVSLLSGVGAATGAWTVDTKTGQIINLSPAPATTAPAPTGPIIDQSKFKPSSTGPVPTSTPIPDAPIGACTPDQKFFNDAYGWRYRNTNEVCKSIWNPPATLVRAVSDCNPATTANCYPMGGANGVVVTPGPVMFVGPFIVPIIKSGDSYAWILDSYKKLTRDQAATIKSQLTVKIDGSDFWRTPDRWSELIAGSPEPGSTSDFWYTQSGKHTSEVISTWPSTTPQNTWLTQMGWMQMFGFSGTEGWDDAYLFGWSDHRQPWPPIAKFKHPTDGKQYGLWASLQPVGGNISAVTSKMQSVTSTAAPGWHDLTPPQTTQSWALRFDIKPITALRVLGGGIGGWISSHVQDVVSAFYHGVWDVAGGLSSALCAMTATPGALTAASAVGGPEAAAAAAATELLLSGNCPVPTTTPTTDTTQGPPTVKGFPTWGYVVIGVAAVGGMIAFLLTPPKKKPLPAHP